MQLKLSHKKIHQTYPNAIIIADFSPPINKIKKFIKFF